MIQLLPTINFFYSSRSSTPVVSLLSSLDQSIKFDFLVVFLLLKMLILFSIIAFSTSCTHYSKKEIVDVSRKQELLIFPNNKTPTGYQLNVFAETDGEFKLQFLQRRWNSEKKKIPLALLIYQVVKQMNRLRAIGMQILYFYFTHLRL